MSKSTGLGGFVSSVVGMKDWSSKWIRSVFTMQWMLNADWLIWYLSSDLKNIFFQVLGLDTPASQCGLKAGDVLVQVFLFPAFMSSDRSSVCCMLYAICDMLYAICYMLYGDVLVQVPFSLFYQLLQEPYTWWSTTMCKVALLATLLFSLNPTPQCQNKLPMQLRATDATNKHTNKSNNYHVSEPIQVSGRPCFVLICPYSGWRCFGDDDDTSWGGSADSRCLVALLVITILYF